MEYAEQYATPIDGTISENIPRRNEIKNLFFIRRGQIRFRVNWGVSLNLKVVLKVLRNDTCEYFIIDTDAQDIHWDYHRRMTREFFIHAFPKCNGPVEVVKFSYIVHLNGHSIPSEHDYTFMEAPDFEPDKVVYHHINTESTSPNSFRTSEVDAAQLQNDVDGFNESLDQLHLTPKFTKGQIFHPFHPRLFIHEKLDWVIERQEEEPDRLHTIKVSVDCIDDEDFINHLIHAAEQGVQVQCVVDWRKMTLTNSIHYSNLKCSKAELIGVVCTPVDPLIEVAPDMHTKFIIFDDEYAVTGSFNITFGRWWANWESGMTFHSKGVCRLLDNIFQSQRGGNIQDYRVDPYSRFNLLYTFGRQKVRKGESYKYYRPHHAILAEINRAQHSIKVCLFLMGELQGAHGESVVDELIKAHKRGVEVHLILNGHLARVGDPGKEVPMEKELERPLLPAVQRLKDSGMQVSLAYGLIDHPVPYCPIHSKYCVIDDHIVLDGSFNWYNTSVFSHDLVIVVSSAKVAKPYLYEFDQILREFRIY